MFKVFISIISFFFCFNAISQNSNPTFRIDISNTNNTILEISAETISKFNSLGFDFTSNSNYLGRNFSEHFDFNKDGFNDLVWVAPKNPSIGSPVMIFLWDNSRKKFVEQTNLFVLGHGDHMFYFDTVYDFDQDGDLDIYLPIENYHGQPGKQASYYFPGGNFMPGNLLFNEKTYLKRVYIDTTTVNYGKKDYPAYWQASLIDYDQDNIKDLIVPSINQRQDNRGYLATKYTVDKNQTISRQFVFPWNPSENYKGQTHSMIFKNYKDKIYAFLQPKEDYPDGKTTFYYYTYPEVWIYNKSINGKDPELIKKIELKRNLNLLNQGQILNHDSFYITDLNKDGQDEFVLGMFSLPQTNEHWAIHIFDQNGTEITNKWFDNKEFLEATKSNGNGYDLVDLNGDGYEDILTRDRFNSTDNDIPIFLNNKNKFEKYVIKTNGPSGFNLAVDINNDGVKEILKVNEYKLGVSEIVTHFNLSYNLVKDLDDDGDGVKNDIDKCPNSTKGAPVGKDGCEIILANQISDQPSPFPNPIEDYISVQFPSTFGERVDVSIYNLIGQELLLKNNVSNGQIIPLNSLSVGNYLLEIQSVDKPMYRLVHKIVKK